MLDGLKNYFLGKDIAEFYKTLKEDYPEKNKKLNLERNKYLLVGKAIPNAMDLGGIVLLFFEPFPGAMLIGAGEAIRHEMGLAYESKKTDYIFNKLHNTIDEAINLMKKENSKLKR